MLHSQCFWGCWFGVSLHFSSFSWGYFISRKHPKKSQILFPLKPESLLTQIFKIWKSKYLDKNLFDKRFISFSDIKTARWVLRIHKSSSSLWILLILLNWRTVALLKKTLTYRSPIPTFMTGELLTCSYRFYQTFCLSKCINTNIFASKNVLLVYFSRK